MTSSASDSALRSIGPYRTLKLLGAGGAANTWLAEDTRNGAKMAIKELQLLSTASGKQVELFERECATLKELSHAQIPRFVETIIERRAETMSLHLVQEHIDGRSLQQVLDAGVRLDAADTVAVMRSCLEPLGYLHGRTPPLYHRDIKPSNVIIRRDGTCVLVDFGAVREALADPRTGGSSVVGTFGYMAPEQFQARAFAATDLYALGAMAVHLVTAIEPSRFEIRRLKPDFHAHLSTDPHLAAILDLLLEPAAEDRYRDVHALRRALDRWQERFGPRETQSAQLVALLARAEAAEAAQPAREAQASAPAALSLPGALDISTHPQPAATSSGEGAPVEPPAQDPVPTEQAPAAAEAAAGEAGPQDAAPGETGGAAEGAGSSAAAVEPAAFAEEPPAAPDLPPPAPPETPAAPLARPPAQKLERTIETAPVSDLFIPGGHGATGLGAVALVAGLGLAAAGIWGGFQYNATTFQAVGAVLAVWGLLLVVVPRRRVGRTSPSLPKQGVVTDAWIERYIQRRSLLGGIEWVVEYEFYGQDELLYTGRMRLANAKAAQALREAGDRLQARYLPWSPDVSALQVRRDAPAPPPTA
jgi:hypothetical protein